MITIEKALYTLGRHVTEWLGLNMRRRVRDAFVQQMNTGTTKGIRVDDNPDEFGMWYIDYNDKTYIARLGFSFEDSKENK